MNFWETGSKRKEVNQINPNPANGQKGAIKMSKNAFAYRIGEGLFCPECYEEAIQSIPKDSGVQIPKKPLNREEIEVYVCKKCKKKRGGVNFDDLYHKIQHCSHKIAFLEDFFRQPRETDEYFSEKGLLGLYFFLIDLGDNLDYALDELWEMHRELNIKGVV